MALLVQLDCSTNRASLVAEGMPRDRFVRGHVRIRELLLRHDLLEVVDAFIGNALDASEIARKDGRRV